MLVFAGIARLQIALIGFGCLLASEEVWEVINLRPAGSSTSQVYSVNGGTQAGIAFFAGRIHAGFWNGDSASWVDLDSPSFPLGSTAAAVDQGVVVGTTIDIDDKENDYSRAAVWFGDAMSYVDLHPPHATQSFAHAVDGSQQGGTARINDDNHAALWSGTAASFQDLNPPGAINSYIHGMAEGMQVGYSQAPLSHACIWNGTAQSWLDLHPGQADASQGWNTDGVQQVGWTIFLAGNVIDHPAVWTSTAESYVDLLPVGWRDGKAQGVFNGRQVGYARESLNSPYRALVWSGTAEAFVDLHQFLPAGKYIRSTGFDIWSDGEYWYAVGQAVRPDFTSDPILWMTPVVIAGDINGDSQVNLLDVGPFVDAVSDGQYVAAADINCDGSVDLLDVGPFVALLSGN